MADILDLICWAVIGVFRSRASLEAEILTLRDLVAWSLCKACLDVEAADSFSIICRTAREFHP